MCDHVSEQEWVYAAQEWIYVLYLSLLSFVCSETVEGVHLISLEWLMECDAQDISANRSK